MTAEYLAEALARLGRRLGEETEDPAELSRREDALLRAEEEILRYLGEEELPGRVDWLLVELAALESGVGAVRRVKSTSYSEGQVSQSESYFEPDREDAARGSILRQLARYRKVACRGEGEEG